MGYLSVLPCTETIDYRDASVLMGTLAQAAEAATEWRKAPAT